MQILVNGRETITVPDEMFSESKEARKHNTSYLNEFQKTGDTYKVNSDFKFRLVCYEALRKLVEGKYLTHLDLFGGMGITAKMFSAGCIHVAVNDIDPGCLEVL